MLLIIFSEAERTMGKKANNILRIEAMTFHSVKYITIYLL